MKSAALPEINPPFSKGCYGRAMQQPVAANLREHSIAAVLNTASGSCTPECEEEMQGIFEEAGLTARLWCGSSEELAGMFEEARASKADVLVVLGGDGTIRSAAAQCTAAGPLLIPLPGGTMNILPKALYGDGSWQDILRRIVANPHVKTVSGGEVQGERFFISAICGAPALWAHAREAIREGSVSEALAHSKVALDHMFADKVNYHFNELHEGTAEVVTITCPLIATTLDDDRKVFEAAIMDVNHAGELLELATAAAFSGWRESKNVALVRTDSVRIFSEQDIPILLDGEPIDAGHEADIVFVPEAFRALVSADEILP